MSGRSPDATWIAFLIAAFCVVGLTGLFATVIAPLPYQRALARDAALDAVLEASGTPDEASRLEALRPRLDDSAAAVLPPGPDRVARVSTERMAMRLRFGAEADATIARLRWLIGLVTLTGAAFGVAVMAFSGRGRG